MQFPFVSRARFEEKDQLVRELRQDLAELKMTHERVLDEINFRSTGFHLYERFVKKEEPVSTATAEANEPAEELTGVEKAIHKVGTRPSAVRRFMELESQNNLAEAEKAASAARDSQRREEARKRLEEALQAGTDKAKAAQAAQA